MTSPLSSVQSSLRTLREVGDGLDIDLESLIVTRSNNNALPQGQVRILSGGGAGHEPGHVGFVGRAFLTTAVSGAIFTSPPVQAILKGILVTGSQDTPILMIVTNYSGDRLNFTLAERMARSRHGYQDIRTILVADDVALDDVPVQVGNRGLAGTILMHKIAGAIADSGKSMNDVYSFCEIVNQRLRTIGVAYDMDWSTSTIKQVELGKGIHGEPGATKLDDQTDFKRIVTILAERFQKIIPEGSRVVILLNNLGGPLHLFQLFCNEVIGHLGFLKIVKVIAGTFFTSLGSNGASLTVLELSEEHEEDILKYLEYDTDLFREQFRAINKPSSFITAALPGENKMEKSTPTGVEVNGTLFRSVLSAVCDVILRQAAALNEMDLEFGDGDTGDTLSRGAVAIREYLSDNPGDEKFKYPCDTFKVISYLLSCKMGGTSGALLGIFFESAAAAFLAKGFESPLWLQLGNQAIAEAGRSKRGDRTMLDVLLAAQESLEEAPEINRLYLILLKDHCKCTAESTRAMIPGSGRGVYNRANAGQDSIFPDPGAALIALIVETVVDVVAL